MADVVAYDNVLIAQAFFVTINLVMRHIKNILILISPLIFATSFFVALNMLDPSAAGPGGVLLVFILIYFLCLSSLYVILRYGLSLLYFVSKRINEKNVSSNYRPINRKKAYLYASVLSLVPIILLALGSFSQINAWDLVLVMVFIVITSLYIQKSS